MLPLKKDNRTFFTIVKLPGDWFCKLKKLKLNTFELKNNQKLRSNMQLSSNIFEVIN